MAAQDKIHDAVKNAPIKDGWTITADPYSIAYKGLGLSADLAAERTLAAERGVERIVVEIKSFLGPSLVYDFQQALGQYEMYRFYLSLTEPDRVLFLAIGNNTYVQFFQREAVQALTAETKIKLVIVDLEIEEVVQWIGQPSIGN